MSQPIRGQGGHLVFPIGPKNTNLVEDVEILLPAKKSVKRFQRRSRKCESLRRTDDGRQTTDNGRCALTIAHLNAQ